RPRASRRRTRSRDRWPRAAAWPRRLRTPRAPCPGAATATAAGSEPVLLRSYLYLRRGCRGGSRLDRTHQLRDHAIEELVHLLRCPADVRGGIELAGRRPDTQPLELGCAGQPLEQVVGALQALAADDLVELLAVPAGLHAAHQQAQIRGELRRRLCDPLQHGQHLSVQLARVRLSGDREHLFESHGARHALVELSDLAVIALEQVEKTRLRAGRSLDATKPQRADPIEQLFGVEREVLHPECDALADRRELRRLEVRVRGAGERTI